MQSVSKLVSIVFLGLMSSFVFAGQFDINKPILCAIQAVDECSVGESCIKVKPETVSLPDFINIDLVNKQVSSAGSSPMATSPIKGFEYIQGKLILQGGDASGDNPRGGVGWTMSLNDATGKMTIAGVADGFAMIVFGSCLQR